VQIPVGLTLDVIPHVEGDAYRIRLTLIPAVTEFLGGTPQGVRVPVIRVRRSLVSVILDDGETVVLVSPAGSARDPEGPDAVRKAGATHVEDAPAQRTHGPAGYGDFPRSSMSRNRDVHFPLRHRILSVMPPVHRRIDA